MNSSTPRMTIWSVAALLLLCAAAKPTSFRPWIAHRLYEKDCATRLIRGPSGPFALWQSCEGALGTYLSVGYVGDMDAPVDEAWSIGERWWHDARWGDDVTSCVWNGDGTTLYVATSGIYGTPGVFRLDLRKKQVLEMTPGGPGEEEDSWEIVGVAGKGQALHVARRNRGEVDTVRMALSPENSR